MRNGGLNWRSLYVKRIKVIGKIGHCENQPKISKNTKSPATFSEGNQETDSKLDISS